MSWACLRCQVPDDQQGPMTQSGQSGHMTQMSHNGHNGHQTAVTDWLGDADDWGDGQGRVICMKKWQKIDFFA